MGDAQRQHSLDEAFERIEETILPTVSMMLDTLLDAATLGKPGVDAETYGAELRAIGLQLEALTSLVEAISARERHENPYRSVSAA
ncbi:MAG TPA: hypothetical protein VNT77_07070 [Allosphingosinicella sp.]|nr:hypothetical protein [Allosphingosinicella sp.]